MRLSGLLAGQAAKLAELTRVNRKHAARATKRQLLDLRAALFSLVPGTWDYLARQAVLAQLEDQLDRLRVIQLASLLDMLRRAAVHGSRSTALVMGQLDLVFTGRRPAYLWDSLDWHSQTAGRLARSAVPEQVRSLAGYQTRVVSLAESRLPPATGETWAASRPKVWAAVRGSVADSQWVVDRLIATQTSAAWNGARLEAMLAEDQRAPRPGDRLQKKLVATFDDVTGNDSVILHGQTVPVDQPFIDVLSGRPYMHPPNRPHDREIVVPWRASYAADFGGPGRYEQATALEVDTLRDTRQRRLDVIRSELVKRRQQLAQLQARQRATPDASLASLMGDQAVLVRRQIGLLESQLRSLQ